jgi:aminocarboxymuconate-semialdehyde decarboxylase
MTITDVHNHIVPPGVLELMSSKPDYDVSYNDGQWDWHVDHNVQMVPQLYDVDAKLASLDEKGIGAAVVSPPPFMFFYQTPATDAMEFCTAYNEGSVLFTEKSNGRLRWLANVPMHNPDDAVVAYRAAVADGARGVGLGTSIGGARMDEPQFERFWAVAAEVGMPVMFHPAFNEAHAALAPYYLQNVIGNPLETTITIERLICAGVLARHPNLRLVLLHGGGNFPYQMGRLRHARTVRPELADSPVDLDAVLQQLWFDSITHDKQALQYLGFRVGASHVVLGTDLPFDMGQVDPVGELRAAFSEESMTIIAEKNPEVLFGDPQTA